MVKLLLNMLILNPQIKALASYQIIWIKTRLLIGKTKILKIKEMK